MRRLEVLSVGLLLLTYLSLAILYLRLTPAWQAPDEPAHYNYVRQLAEGTVPVIETGDWDQAYLGEVVSSRFDPTYSVSGFTYEDWQPPLYYLLQVPVYKIAAGSLQAMRLLSVVLGAGVVLLAYLIARRVFGGVVRLALTTAVFVALLPQHLAILASVNNDSLAELVIALILFVLIIPWPDVPPTGRLLGLGLLLGLGFLTKGTAYLMAPVCVVFVLARYWLQWRPLARALVLLLVPAILLGALWWMRNVLVYDGPDVLARNAHDAVVVGQPRTAEWVAQYGVDGTLARFIRTTFNSFWGQFGWMAAPLPGWMYGPLLLLTVAGIAGLIPAGITGWRVTRGRRRTDDGGLAQPYLQLLVLGLTFLLTLALHVVYNLTFVQHQGRYLFPALIPIAVGLTLGWGYWWRPVARRWPWAEYFLPLGLGVVLVGISVFALTRILPGLAPG